MLGLGIIMFPDLVMDLARCSAEEVEIIPILWMLTCFNSRGSLLLVVFKYLPMSVCNLSYYYV